MTLLLCLPFAWFGIGLVMSIVYFREQKAAQKDSAYHGESEELPGIIGMYLSIPFMIVLGPIGLGLWLLP